jgi:hypothetical protein
LIAPDGGPNLIKGDDRNISAVVEQSQTGDAARLAYKSVSGRALINPLQELRELSYSKAIDRSAYGPAQTSGRRPEQADKKNWTF